MSETKERPYFIWNADLAEDDVRQILARGIHQMNVQINSERQQSNRTYEV